MLKNHSLSRIIPIALAVLLLITEVVDDLVFNAGAVGFFMIMEILGILLLAATLWWEINQREKAEQHANEALARSERLAGDMARHIDDSFDEWQLSKAEHEVAWLLLKGFSFAEMAEIRNVKEKTLRQQATRIYAKGNISGRSELAAAFLQDVLLSREERLQMTGKGEAATPQHGD